MAGLLVGLGIMAVALSVALPSWRTASQREREAELVFRGEQYARAIALYQRKFANAFPPTVDLLVDQRFLRKKYKDPMSKDGEFELLYAGQSGGAAGQVTQNQVAGQQGRGSGGMAQTPLGQAPGSASLGAARGGIMGVVSRSSGTSLRLYNGRDKYNEWTFVATQATTQAGSPTGSESPTGGSGGAAGVGSRGRGGRDGRGGRGSQDTFGPGNRQNGPSQGGAQPRGGGAGGGFGTGIPGPGRF